ncbi:MAG TPA: OmpA family protein [Spirochaetota bacterium]|nr:OmpA family protein [Spirochaetota bacterium]
MRVFITRYICILFFINVALSTMASDNNAHINLYGSRNRLKKNRNITGAKIDYSEKYPFSLYLSLSNAYPIPIRQPESNYFIEIPANLGAGIGFEYLFTKWTALDLNLNINFGFLWQRKNYEDTGAPCYYEYFKKYSLDMLEFNLYLQQLISLKLYTSEFPIKFESVDLKDKNKKIKKEVKSKFFIRLGATLEGWFFSKYSLYRNEESFAEGNFLDNIQDGPNPYGDLINYQGLINPVLFGPHLGIGLKMYKGETFSFQPEIRVTFCGPPYMDGSKEGINIKGNDLIMIRNDGKNDDYVKDYKITIEFVSSFYFTIKPISHEKKVIKIVLDFLNFYADSTKLLPESEKKLKLISLSLFKYRKMKFKFVGHANSTGNKKKELNLSIIRAKTIGEYLIKHGITIDKNSSFEGRGSDENIGSTNTEDGKRKNRRVEIFISE